MTDQMFTETEDIPSGRKARVISKQLWATLEDSAKRGVAFFREDTPDAIEELRKDLSAAAVKAVYEVTTSTARLESGAHKLTFSAQKHPAPTKPDGAVSATK